MNPSRGLWSDLPMSTGIATLVCYAGVFNDVIGVEEMAARLGVPQSDEFYSALNELHLGGRLILKNGFASLPNLAEKIDVKASKMETAGRLIDSRMEDLKKLGKNPLIRFVGVSGSVAANNPTKDRKGLVDVDVFLITRNQCLWLYEIPKRLRYNFFPRAEPDPKLCINYVMDESDLRIENRNFFTATEIKNLIPIAGFDTFKRFCQANNWVDHYYPGFSGCSDPASVPCSWNLINKPLYVLATLLYCAKHSNLDYLRKLTFKTDHAGGTNHRRVSASSGGYQALIHEKFTRLAAIWFADLLNEPLVERLFPDDLSKEIRRGAPECASFDCDYSKYGFQRILPKSS